MGTGFSPAVQSVALVLYAKKGGVETGKPFGAISLIQVIRCDYIIILSMCGLCTFYGHGFSSQILVPFVYGFMYVRTVTIYPLMIFLAFAATYLILHFELHQNIN